MVPFISSLPLRALVAGSVLAIAAVSAEAAPVAIGAARSGDGDGLNALWVRSEFVAHSTGEARSILASALTQDGGFIEAIEQLVPYVDHDDGTTGLFNSPNLPDPFSALDAGTDWRFAVRFDGYLNVVTAGEYDFLVHSDDGFSLSLGGEIISSYDTDRAPGSTVSGPIFLEAGLYALELVSWEQGGFYIDELAWLRPGADGFAVIGTAEGGLALYSAVPLPTTLPLLFSALGGIGLLARRRRD